MQTLEITIDNAKAAFKEATAEGKKLLNKLFPQAILSGNICDSINGMDDVERITGQKLVRRADETDDEYAYRECKLIALAYNGGKVLSNKQTRHFPYHLIDDSGSALSYYDYVNWLTGSTVGVRLCFGESAHAIDAGKKFIPQYTNLKIK